MLDALASWITRHETLAPGMECVGRRRWWIPWQIRSWALSRVIRRAARRAEIPPQEEHGEMQ